MQLDVTNNEGNNSRHN